MHFAIGTAAGAALITALAFGCSSDDNPPGPANTGGMPGTGGAATGGLPSSGGSAAGGGPATGGVVSTGGLPATGGTVSSGGASSGGASSGGASSGGASSGGASSGGASSGGASSGGSTGSGGSSATACTGKPGSKRGKVNATVTAGGAQRTFIYYAPQGLDANKPVPIVIVPHGYTMSGQAMYDITKHTTIADREKFIAIFPDGTVPNPWNVGAGVCGAGAAVGGTGNDQAFVDEMLKYAEADQCVDKDHIFMTGFSMGGYFSNETGCLRSNIRAVGPHSGGSHDLAACPVQHKPVILFHFKNDALIAYDCGTGARDRWVAKNGCTKTAPEVVTVKGGTCEYYKGCPADGQVAMCSFDAQTGQGETIAGHAWSGGNANAFAIPNTESAAELGWAFFKKYAW